MVRMTTNSAARSDAWGRAAQRARVAAARVGCALSDEEIMHLDVYDLRILGDGVRRASTRHGLHQIAFRRLPLFGGALIREPAASR